MVKFFCYFGLFDDLMNVYLFLDLLFDGLMIVYDFVVCVVVGLCVCFDLYGFVDLYDLFYFVLFYYYYD